MRPRRRMWVSVALGLAVVGALWAALTLPGGVGRAATTRAPSFSVPRLGGGPRVSLPLVGQGAHAPVVLTFFASWCTSCRTELPLVASVAHAQSVAHSPVVFLGIDDNDAASTGLAFARHNGITFPVGDDFYTEVGGDFRLEGLPDTVFINAAGDVVATVRGPVTRPVLEHWLSVLDRGGSGALAA